MNDDRKTWKHKGSDGRFHVWHAGKNLYYVTDGKDGIIVNCCTQFGTAFSSASHHARVAKCEAATPRHERGAWIKGTEDDDEDYEYIPSAAELS